MLAFTHIDLLFPATGLVAMGIVFYFYSKAKQNQWPKQRW